MNTQGMAPLNSGLKDTILDNSVTSTSITTALVAYDDNNKTLTKTNDIHNEFTFPSVFKRTVSLSMIEKGTVLCELSFILIVSLQESTFTGQNGIVYCSSCKL